MNKYPISFLRIPFSLPYYHIHSHIFDMRGMDMIYIIIYQVIIKFFRGFSVFNLALKDRLCVQLNKVNLLCSNDKNLSQCRINFIIILSLVTESFNCSVSLRMVCRVYYNVYLDFAPFS